MSHQPTLFSYCIPYDDGAAPNPFWNECTLAICKPVIRRTARVGDWIAGTGSTRFGIEGRLVYAMRVDEVMSFEEYDRHCRSNNPNKIPDPDSTDLRRRTGDCLYDYSQGFAVKRPGAHDNNQALQERDFRGRNVLLSKQFYYFGCQPIELGNGLYGIIRQGQGHKSRMNDHLVLPFIEWIEGAGHQKNVLHAMPQAFNGWQEQAYPKRCAERRMLEDEEDERLETEEASSGCGNLKFRCSY